MTPTVLSAKELGRSLSFQFDYAHQEALKYENIYRRSHGLPANQGGTDAPMGNQIFNSFPTHTESLTIGQGGRIVDFEVVKKQ